MAAVLNLILTKQVTADQVVSWLGFSSNKGDVPESLQVVDRLRNEFVAFFLNFLRDQSSRLIQNGQPTGQTPIKLSEKISHEKEKRRSAQPNRVQLFPSEEDTKIPLLPATPKSLPATPQIAKTGSSHRNFRKHQSLSPSEAVPNAPHARYEPRSQQKLNLGQFIVTPSNYRKRVSPTSSRKDVLENSFSPYSVDASPNFRAESVISHNEANVINLSDMQDFPPVGTPLSTTKKAQRRRITPTAVKSEQLPSSNKLISSDVKSETSSVFNSVFLPVENDSENNLHAFMRNGQDRALVKSIAATSVPADGSVVPKQFNPLSNQSSSLEVMLAEPQLATLTEELDSLVVIYSACLDGCLVPNLCVELYFLIQLLTVRGHIPEKEFLPDVENGDEISYLGTVHNCVYFAAQVLHRQQRVIELLDQGTLRLLADNPRIETFCPDLRRFLSALSVNLHSKTYITVDWAIGSVPFQTDTDNRNNFPDEQAFRIFRKQRDLFYELLRDWNANHMSPSWTMATRLGNRIHSVVTMWSDPVVYSHFARLFISQLIAACKGNVQQNCQDSNSTDGDFLIDLQKSNPEKFKRLQERFVTPRRIGGPAPLPSFPGAQEFFRDFIVLAGCPKFNQHLTDCLLFKLLKLNSIHFTLPEKEMQGNIDDTLRQHFVTTVLTLRLLGKFLGFVIFLPYQNVQRLPEDILADQIQTRNKVRLVLDITAVLRDAVAERHLLLTVPWIVELLSMMDCVAPLLDDINQGLTFLVHLYKSSFFFRSPGSFNLNQLFLLFLLGWLFETPNFPTSLFFGESRETIDAGYALCEEMCSTEGSLDGIPLVDHHLLYTCCAFLGELKVVLNEFASGIRSRSSTIKKITPVAATDVNNSSISSRKLELQLEEHFFHNQPSSMRKTVEFVSERMTSNIIKQMRKSTIPTVRKAAEDDLCLYLSSAASQQKSKAVLKRIQELSAEKCLHVRKEAEELSLKYCEERIRSTLTLLLAEEMADTVLTTCCKITFRLIQENVVQWVTRHVTNNLFTDDLRTEWARFKATQLSKGKLVKRPPSSPNVTEGNGTAKCYAHISCTDVMVDLKAYSKNLFSYGEGLSITELNKLLADVQCALLPSQELTSTLQKNFGQLSLELLVGLAILKPAAVNEEQMSNFIKIWKQSSSKNQQPAPNVICSRSLLLLTSLPDAKDNWQKLEDLLLHFLAQEVLTVQDLKNQCLRIFKGKTPCELLKTFSKFVESVVTKWRSTMPAESTNAHLVELQKAVTEFGVATRTSESVLSFCE